LAKHVEAGAQIVVKVRYFKALTICSRGTSAIVMLLAYLPYPSRNAHARPNDIGWTVLSKHIPTPNLLTYNSSVESIRDAIPMLEHLHAMTIWKIMCSFDE